MSTTDETHVTISLEALRLLLGVSMRKPTPKVETPCNGWRGCVLEKGHDSQCLDKDGWPARWSDPTYLGDGPWGA